MSDLSHPQTSLSFLSLSQQKHSLLVGTAKGKATPETSEPFWGDEADTALQSRSSIAIFIFLPLKSFQH